VSAGLRMNSSRRAAVNSCGGKTLPDQSRDLLFGDLVPTLFGLTIVREWSSHDAESIDVAYASPLCVRRQ
jgi:hypothetical protein